MRRAVRPGAALGAALWVVAAPAVAATLAEHFAAAVERSPEVALAQGEVRASAARARGAARLYKGAPQLSLGYFSDDPLTDDGFVEQEYELGAEMWLPGERRAATLEPAPARRLGLAGRDVARLELAARVRSAYWDLALAERLLEIERQAASREAETRDAVARLVEARELPPNDAELASAALAARQREAATLAAQADAAAAVLEQLTGIARSAGVAEARTGDVPSEGSGLDPHPELLAAVARRDMLAAAAERSARDLGASPELAIVMRRERAVQGAPYEESIGLRVTVPFGRSAESGINRFEVAAAAAAATLAESRQRERVVANLRLAQRAHETAEANAVLARGERDALARVLAGVEAAYREGEGSFLELQRAREGLLEAERDLAEAENRAGRALSDLLQAEGRLP